MSDPADPSDTADATDSPDATEPATPTAPVHVFVVRHGRAGSRSRWKGDDRDRPLTKSGIRQAEGVADLLVPAAPTRILSSPYLRCEQTVAPLGRRVGVDVEIIPALTEGAWWPDALRLVTEAKKPLVLCSHGDVIGDLVRAIAEQTPVKLGSDGPALAKASVWAIEVTAGEVTAVRYLPPPA